MSAPEKLAHDGRIHLLLNPVSTGYRRVVKDHIFEVILAYGGDVNILHSKPKEEETQDMLLNELQAGDMLVTAGGDGLDAVAVRALIDSPDIKQEIRQTPVLSWFGGNANAGPSEHQKKRPLRRPSLLDTIRNGIVIDIHPLLSSVIADPDAVNPETEELIEYPKNISLYFEGLGGSGKSTVELEHVRHHSFRQNVIGRNLVDAIAAFKGLRQSPYYLVRETQFNSEGEVISQSAVEKVHEISIVNGAKMAKIGRFPSRLDEDQYFRAMTSDKRLSRLMKDITKMALAKPPGNLIDSDISLQFEFEAINKDDQLWAHSDGDPRKMPAKGIWIVSQHPNTYRAVQRPD